MKTALLHMTLLMIVDYVLIIGVCFAAIMLMESEFIKRLKLRWNKLVDGFWSIVYRVKMAVRKGIRFTLQELQNILDDIKRSELWDSFKRYSSALIYRIFWLSLIGGFFAVVIFAHWKYPATTASNIVSVSYLTYMWEFVTENSIMISIIATFIGIFLVGFALRPRFSISDNLVQTTNGLLRVQITNGFSLINLVDVKVEMAFIRWDEETQSERTEPMTMNRSTISVIYGLYKGVSRSSYTIHTESGFVWNDKYTGIRCRVIATHSISGIKRIKEKRFNEKQIIHGAFVGRRIIEDKNRYCLPGNRIWGDDLQHRSDIIFELSKTVLCSIKPVLVEDVDKDSINTAIDEVKHLYDADIKELFRCIDKNQDTISALTKGLEALKKFYEEKTNLNPENKKMRKEIFDVINKNLTYLTDQMAKDIEQVYTEQLKAKKQ